MKQTLATTMLAASLIAAPAFAHEEDGRGTVWSWLGDWDPSFYAGASLHQGDYSDWSTVARVDSSTYTARSSDEQATGFRVSGGMKFLDNFAVEATYADFGGASFAGVSDGSGAVWEPGTQREDLEVSGVGLHLVGRLPLTRALFFTARAGAWSLRSERHQTVILDDAGTPTQYDIRDTGNSTSLGYGASLDYDGFAPIRLALEYDTTGLEETGLESQQGFGDGELRSIGLSVRYLFTGESP